MSRDPPESSNKSDDGKEVVKVGLGLDQSYWCGRIMFPAQILWARTLKPEHKDDLI